MGDAEGSHAPPAPEAADRYQADRYQVEGAVAAAVPRFVDLLRIRQPSIFWSLVLHFIFCQVTQSCRVAFMTPFHHTVSALCLHRFSVQRHVCVS